MLEIDALVKRYGPKVALDGVTFTVEPGQVFGFVGRNGAAPVRAPASCACASTASTTTPG